MQPATTSSKEFPGDLSPVGGFGAVGESADGRDQGRPNATGQVMSHAGHHQQLGVGQGCGGGLATGQLDEWVGVAVHDQGGCSDMSQCSGPITGGPDRQLLAGHTWRVEAAVVSLPGYL